MKAALISLVLLLLIGPAGAADHPSIRDPSTAKCANCHDETMGGSLKHSPAEDDCTFCHEFTEGAEKLQVKLSSPEPGLCVDCHDDLQKAADADLLTPHGPVADTCTSCHSPHSADGERLLISQPPELCLDCHDDVDESHALAVSRSDCRGCHDPHGSDVSHALAGGMQHEPFAERSCDSCHRKGLGKRVRLNAKGAELCFACHGDMEDKLQTGVVHSPVAAGECLGCHNPHLAAQSKLLEAPDGELCFSCHPDIEEKVKGKTVHAALEDGCTTCHDPHQADHPLQLAQTPPTLCHDCHDPDDGDLKGKHLGADLSEAACTTCHDPHGSADDHLLAGGSVHEPFRDGCDTCHEGSASQLMEGGGTELCVVCHDDVMEYAGQARVPHEALELGTCIDCHTPHASPRPRLLKARTVEVCGECHDDQVAALGQTQHGVIDAIGCHACHLPHGGESASLLREENPDLLCLSCHDPGRLNLDDAGETITLLDSFEVTTETAKRMGNLRLSADGERNHPILNHRVLGTPTEEELAHIETSFEGDLRCLVCHDAHKGAMDHLPASTESGEPVTCDTCHQK